MQIAPSTYYATKNRIPSARERRDAELTEEITRCTPRTWASTAPAKSGTNSSGKAPMVARCTVERLMRAAGLRGIPREKTRKTTIGDGAETPRPADTVNRQFVATAPNQLWVADLTYIRTYSGWVYAAFVLDVYSRRIVGWQVSTSLRTDLALDALEMGLWARRRAGQDTTGLVHHSDRGVQGGIRRSSQHLDHGGVWWRDSGVRWRMCRRRVVGSGQRIWRYGRRCGHRGGRSHRGRCSVHSGG